VLLDGYGYRTRGHALRYYARRLRRPGWWLSVPLQLLPRPPAPVPQWTRDFPPRERFRADLAGLLARGVHIRLIYTGAVERHYNHAGQFAEAFPELAGRVEHDYFGDADHTFAEQHLRERLVEGIAGWIRRHFPAQPIVAAVG
jgi:hypothetical protein